MVLNKTLDASPASWRGRHTHPFADARASRRARDNDVRTPSRRLNRERLLLRLLRAPITRVVSQRRATPHGDARVQGGENDSLLALARHLRLQLCLFGELAIRLAPVPTFVEALFLDGVEHGSQLGCSSDTRRQLLASLLNT